MKKILAILFLLSVAFSVPQKTEAQSFFTTPTKTQTVGESAFTDAGIDTLNVTLTGASNQLLKIQFRATKATGTIAGTARLYGSLYGTTSTWHAIGDTLTLGNSAINEHAWDLQTTDLGWKYLRILRSGGTTMTGTQSAIVRGISQ